MTGEGAPLSARERTFAVCAVRALGPRAGAFCARLAPHGGLLGRYAEWLAGASQRVREAALELDRPAPPDLGKVHHSWYAPPSPSERPDANRWLARRAYGQLVEMSPAAPDSLLARLESAASGFGELLVALGRRRVAIAFAGAPRAALAQLCVRLGEPAASELLAQVRAVAPKVEGAEVESAQRALLSLGLAGGELTESVADLFRRIGGAWLAPALVERGGRESLRRLAQRLERSLGERLLEDAAVPAHESDRAAAVTAALGLLPRAHPRR